MKTSIIIRTTTMISILLLLIGCSSATKTLMPSSDESSDSLLFDKDHYQITLDRETGDVELIHRTAQDDVTPYFTIKLISYQWDPKLLLLYATVEIENIVDTPFWGANLVFDSTGGRWLVNSDGYGYWGPMHAPPIKRMPFISFNRDYYHRIITGKDRRELIFHCPPPVTTIDFWLDAVRPWERDEPMVEEQFCHKTAAISVWAVTASCYDYQTHHMSTWRGDINELKVWANLTAVGGPSEALMFDDGMHFDYAEGDGIYGIDFVPDPMVNFGMITIYAEDSHGNLGENDVAFIRNFTLRDYSFETIEKGFWSELTGPYYDIIRDQARWEQFWHQHKGTAEDPPYVDFSEDMVLVAIAGLAGGGQWIEIKRIFENTKHKLEIQGSTWNGSKGCILPYLATNAYHIVKMKKNSMLPDPKLRPRLFYCDEQLPYTVVENGLYSNIHDERALLVTNWNDWKNLWNEHSGGSSEPPYIDFDQFTVAAAFLGDRELQDTYVKFDRVMIYESPMREIYFSEHYPGAGCVTHPLDCQPYEIIVFSRDDSVTYSWFNREFPDDCW